MRRALTTPELRISKSTRDEFLARPRRPITVVLDGVGQNYNIGFIFRLCDAFLVRELVICGTKVELHKRRLVQAARGTQHWVPWRERQHNLPFQLVEPITTTRSVPVLRGHSPRRSPLAEEPILKTMPEY
jgi:tRNA G18 (ribose-2'-O)-methylase SpoU